MRQYIGARYVPKFYEGVNGEAWVSGITYEPLTIVSYSGNLFVSKKAVPATVGEPNINPNYWANFGVYSSVLTDVANLKVDVNELDGRVDNLEDEIGEITGATHGKYLFVGDSYSLPEYGDWIEKTANLLGLESGEYWNLGVSGSSIVGGYWLNQVTAWVNSHPNDIDSIKTIVLGGGINDSSEANLPHLPAAFTALANYCKTTFGNDVKILVFYFGFALDTSPILSGRTGYWRSQAQKYYASTGAIKCTYIGGGELVLHNRSFLDGDGLHPNGAGGDAIAGVIASAIRGGVPNVSYSGNVSFNGNYTVGGTVTQEIYGNANVFRFDDLGIDFGTGVNFTGRQYVEIANAVIPFGNKCGPFTANAVVWGNTQGLVTRNVKVKIENGKLYIAIEDFNKNDNDWYTDSVKQILSLSASFVAGAVSD